MKRAWPPWVSIFIRAEAVAAIGQAFSSGRLPVEKTVAVFGKHGTKHLARARVGTPVGKSCSATFDVEINDQDKIIFGGPMTGNAIYSEDLPIRAGYRRHPGSGQKRHSPVQRLSMYQLR